MLKEALQVIETGMTFDELARARANGKRVADEITEMIRND